MPIEGMQYQLRLTCDLEPWKCRFRGRKTEDQRATVTIDGDSRDECEKAAIIAGWVTVGSEVICPECHIGC
jgi:hypothetical protein